MKIPVINWFGDPLREAKEILGEECVVSYKEVKSAFKMHWVSTPKSHYSPSTYEWCKEQNERGELWRLTCRLAVSIEDIQKKLPRQFIDARVWTDRPAWITKRAESAYRLINFKPMKYGSHEFLNSGSGIDRAWAVTAVQALLAFKLVHKKRYLLHDFHFADPEGDVVPVIGCNVGPKNEPGLLLYNLPAESQFFQSDLATSLACRIPEVHQQ